MYTYYRKSDQVTIPDNSSSKCDCGESSALNIDYETKVITCDACYSEAPMHQQWNDADIVSQFGAKVASNTYDFWNETYFINPNQSLTHL